MDEPQWLAGTMCLPGKASSYQAVGRNCTVCCMYLGTVCMYSSACLPEEDAGSGQERWRYCMQSRAGTVQRRKVLHRETKTDIKAGRVVTMDGSWYGPVPSPVRPECQTPFPSPDDTRPGHGG